MREEGREGRGGEREEKGERGGRRRGEMKGGGGGLNPVVVCLWLLLETVSMTHYRSILFHPKKLQRD